MEKVRILFLAVTPETPKLEEEFSKIEQALQGSTYREQFEYINFPIGQFQDFGNYLKQVRPHICHISSHGHSDGELKIGEQYVPNDFLANLFAEANDYVQCVVLNACYSKAQADEIARYIKCVIGTKGDTDHDIAIAFSKEFYNHIGNGADVTKAFITSYDFVKAIFKSQFDPDYLAMLPTKDSGKNLILVPVSIAPALISSLNNARLKGEEGDRKNGSFYTYDVGLKDVSRESYIPYVEQGNYVQEYRFYGKWFSHIYGEENISGMRVNYYWGPEGNRPYGDFRVFVKVINGEHDQNKLDLDPKDDRANNYAADKVKQLIDSKTSKEAIRGLYI